MNASLADWVVLALLVAIAYMLLSRFFQIASNVEAILETLKDIREAVEETAGKPD